MLKGEFYLKRTCSRNFYFHVTTAYALLRHNGVELGKGRYLGRWCEPAGARPGAVRRRAALLLNLTPGPDVLFVAGTDLRRGRATATLMAALGVGAAACSTPCWRRSG